MTEPTSSALKRRRRQLLRKMPPLDAVLRGSLIERYKRCGNPNCKCAGFQTLLARGIEWAASGKVTIPLPARFPTIDKAVFTDVVEV